MIFRTDKNNNPTAFTTDLAKEAGLIEGTDYEVGDPFTISGHVFYTAHILGNALSVTIKLIDKVGFYTTIGGVMRWSYIAIPFTVWENLSYNWKVFVIGFMYSREGGTTMKDLFTSTQAPVNIGIGVASGLGFGDKVNG